MLTYIVAGCWELTTVALISALDSCRRMLQHQLSKPGYVVSRVNPDKRVHDHSILVRSFVQGLSHAFR